MLEFLFWFSIIMIIYAYLGYPISLVFLLVIKKIRRILDKQDVSAPEKLEEKPSVSLIIAAYNEEMRIKDKIENSLALNYPKDKFEIIVASDCSTDNTDSIVESFKHQFNEIYNFIKLFDFC